MSRHKNQLKGLYAITDETLIPEKHFNQAVESALKGGAKIIQYRDKSDNQKKRFIQATVLCQLSKQYDSLCIINDDIELAKTVNADGVHLGKNDTSITEARQILGDDAIIGISCYNDLTLAIEAEKNTADYVAFGAIFSSSTKPDANIAGLDIISKAKSQLSIPICTIGGITENNIQKIVEHGADMTAVINGLFNSNDITLSAKSLSQHFH